MPNIRDRRINEELKKEISDIFFSELKNPDVGFVSIIRVDVAHDLKTAKIYYSVLGTEEETKRTDKAVQKSSGFIRHEIARRLNLRYTPELTFILDDSIEHGIRIASILQEEKKKHHEE